MKKIIVLLLALSMTFTLVGCSNNDENNATVLAKINEMEKEAQGVTAWYEANGYFDGVDAEDFQEITDTVNDEIASIKTAYQENVDNGGYYDDIMESTVVALDDMILQFNVILEEAKALHPGVLVARSAAMLSEKHDVLTELVTEVLELGEQNGWEEDDAYLTDLTEMMNTVTTTASKLDNLATMDTEEIAVVSTEYDEMIADWQITLNVVSEKY